MMNIIVKTTDNQVAGAICILSSLLGGFVVGVVSLVSAPFFGTQALTQGLVFCTVTVSIALSILMSPSYPATVEGLVGDDIADEIVPDEKTEDSAAAESDDDIAAFVDHLKQVKAAEDTADAAEAPATEPPAAEAPAAEAPAAEAPAAEAPATEAPVPTATPTLEATVTETLTATPSTTD